MITSETRLVPRPEEHIKQKKPIDARFVRNA